MTRSIFLIFLWSLRSQASVFQPEITCYGEFADFYSNGGQSVVGKKLALVPSNKSYEKGFYIFSPTMSYYCPLPHPPTRTKGKVEEYLLNVHVSHRPPFTIEFHRHTTAPEKSKLVKESNAAENVKVHCNERLDYPTRDILLRDILRRIKGITERYPQNTEAIRKALRNCQRAVGASGRETIRTAVTLELERVRGPAREQNSSGNRAQ